MTVLDLILGPYNLDSRSFLAGSLYGMLFAVFTWTLAIIITWVRG